MFCVLLCNIQIKLCPDYVAYAQGRRYGFWAPWTAYSLGPSCLPGGLWLGIPRDIPLSRDRDCVPEPVFFPLLPNQIILFQPGADWNKISGREISLSSRPSHTTTTNFETRQQYFLYGHHHHCIKKFQFLGWGRAK